jgi:hypothetical protein
MTGSGDSHHLLTWQQDLFAHTNGIDIGGIEAEVVTDADDPDGHRVAERPAWPPWRDLQFAGTADLVELVARPSGQGGSAFFIG